MKNFFIKLGESTGITLMCNVIPTILKLIYDEKLLQNTAKIQKNALTETDNEAIYGILMLEEQGRINHCNCVGFCTEMVLRMFDITLPVIGACFIDHFINKKFIKNISLQYLSLSCEAIILQLFVHTLFGNFQSFVHGLFINWSKASLYEKSSFITVIAESCILKTLWSDSVNSNTQEEISTNEYLELLSQGANEYVELLLQSDLN